EYVAEHSKHFIRIHKPYKSFKPTRMDIAYMSMASTSTGALSNSHSIFLQTVVGQGSEEQVQFWAPKALSFEICGSYAQTELGHGSNIRGLQTTAVYDKSTEEFILNTPTLQSIKWWPGCLGKVATHVVLYAQLIIDGKEYGLNVFMLQIRDENHLPLPGIRLGDLGTKVGDHENDTGFMILDNVRVPREYMLNKFKNVTKEGVFEVQKDIDPRVVYMTMISTRAMMVMTAGARLAQSATIAVRYSLVRKQGFIDTKKGVSFKTPEHSIFDHKIQRYKLMKYLSQAYVIFFAGRWVIDFLALTEGKNMGIIKDTSLLKEIMATSAGMKSLTSYMATVGIEELRKSCGGNGYLLNSGIAAISCDYLWQVTAEGDYTILALLTGAHILNSLGKTFGGKKLQGVMDYFNVITTEEFHLSKVKPAAMKRSSEFTNLTNLLDLFRYRSLEKNIETAIEFNKRITKKEEKFETAFGHLAQEIVKGVYAHCQYVMVKTFEERIKSSTNNKIKDTLRKILIVYCLTQFLDENWGEVINGDQYRLIRNCLNETLDELRPDAIGLVDAFDFPDTVLKSTIGRYDGNIYEALFDSAQRSTLNQKDPYDGYKYLQPHTNKTLLKTGNKPVLGQKF
ncbi:MAG: acyl-CoA dehydrogenase, partial [bacterium]